MGGPGSGARNRSRAAATLRSSARAGVRSISQPHLEDRNVTVRPARTERGARKPARDLTDGVRIGTDPNHPEPLAGGKTAHPNHPFDLVAESLLVQRLQGGPNQAITRRLDNGWSPGIEVVAKNEGRPGIREKQAAGRRDVLESSDRGVHVRKALGRR